MAVATGTRHVYIAGQVSADANGQRVAAGDLAGQVAQAYRNVAVALTAAEATFSDVVWLTFYVVNWKPEMTEAFWGMETVRDELHMGRRH